MNSIIGVELDKTKPKLNIKSFLVNKTFKWASFWGRDIIVTLLLFVHELYANSKAHHSATVQS